MVVIVCYSCIEALIITICMLTVVLILILYDFDL